MTLRAGIGTATINPPVPVRLAGFAEVQDATEIHDDLTARAVLLDSGTSLGAVCLVVCDLMGMSPEFANPARAAVAKALELDEAAVLLSSTHAHAAPSTMAGTERLGWFVPEGYKETLVDGCVRAALEARARVRDARLKYGRWSLPDGLSINRRGHPYDPWFSALDIVVADDPQLRIGTIANLAIHPVALGPECLAVSADWVHPFREALQQRAGGTPVELSGALGDVNPRHVHRQGNECTRDGFAEAAELGGEVAEVLGGVLSQTEWLDDGGVRVVADRNIDVPIGGTPLADGRRGDTMRVELVEWAIGPVRLVSIPGEAFQAFGCEVSSARGDKVLLAGLSPLWQGYFPVPFVEGGYEERTSYGPNAVRAVLDALLDVPSAGDSL